MMDKETNLVNGIQPSAKKMPLTVQLVATYPTYHQRGNGIYPLARKVNLIKFLQTLAHQPALKCICYAEKDTIKCSNTSRSLAQTSLFS